MIRKETKQRLKAIAKVASKDHTRYHLMGVWCFAKSDKDIIRLVATDGHILSEATVKDGWLYEKLQANGGEGLINHDMIKTINSITDLQVLKDLSIFAANAKPYNFDQLIPKQTETVIGLDLNLLARLVDALKVEGKKTCPVKFVFQRSGDLIDPLSPVLLETTVDGLRGVIMPVRLK